MSRHWFGAVIRKTTFGHKGVNYANGNQYATGGGFSPAGPEEKKEDEEDPEGTGTTDPPPNTEKWPTGSRREKDFWESVKKGEAVGLIEFGDANYYRAMALRRWLKNRQPINKYASIEIHKTGKRDLIVRAPVSGEPGGGSKIIFTKEGSNVYVRVATNGVHAFGS